VSRYYSHFNTAVNFVQSYKQVEPFAAFLKKQFAAHKKFGSKDRKSIAHLCYCYFRLGKLMNSTTVEERMMAGLFLCTSTHSDILKVLKPEWNEKVELPVREKLNLLQLKINDLFPFVDSLSNGVDAVSFCLSHFIQPDLFLRIRPGFNHSVIQKLSEAGINYLMKGSECIALPNNTKIDQLLLLNKEAVVQDYSSQRVGELLKLVEADHSLLNVWDCCAASGGKSIMAKDVLGDIRLTVSDVRESILINLNKRFNEAGIINFKSFIADLSKNLPAPFPSTNGEAFQLIIADVPCSGSGTWRRTPEYLSSFTIEQLEQYAQLQKNIISSVEAHLQSGSYLLYITCSVYKQENEEIVEFIKKSTALHLVQINVLKGYEEKADSMFAALLRKK
jgi:16S rRNA (cytosine967-C5)-methyltransferase